MKRRKFIQLGFISTVCIGLSSSKVVAFGLKNILGGGGGGGGGWGAIAKDFKGGMKILAKQSQKILLAIADLADAIGLRDEAAVCRTEAKKIQDQGSLSAEELDLIAAQSKSTQDLVLEKMKETETLTVEQKKKIAQGAAKYAPAVLKGGIGLVRMIAALSKAGSAGTPGISDGLEIISLVKDMPVLVPKARSFITNAVEGGNKLREAMLVKGIEAPEKIEMPM